MGVLEEKKGTPPTEFAPSKCIVQNGMQIHFLSLVRTFIWIAS